MKTLVTGGGGFAGSYLVKQLQAAGHKVTSLGNGTALAEQQDIYQQIDLEDLEAVKKQLDFASFDVVFHLAGLTNVGESFEQPAKYFSVNSAIQINLFEACLSQKAAPRFLIVSSAHVYKPGVKLPLTEASPLQPTSPYAASKLGQEIIGNYYSSRGFEVITARAFNHIGPGQMPGFIVPDFAKRIAEAEKQPQPTITVGNLEAERDYTDVRDIVRAYVMLAEKAKPGEIYNICSGNPLSGQALLDNLLGFCKTKIAVRQDPQLMRPSDNPKIFGDNSKLKKDTGWEAEIPLEQTLKETLEDWRSRV